MARVTVLTHSEFLHRQSRTLFLPTRVSTDAGTVMLGVADVDDAVAREWFLNHPSFRVDDLANEAPASETTPNPAAAETNSTAPVPKPEDAGVRASVEDVPMSAAGVELAADAAPVRSRRKSVTT